MRHNSSIFREDIEGLRAIAVFLAIFYHYEIPGVSGGFVGVDVFFVISGYLITELIRRRLYSGEFRFADFYARRLLRLLPILLLVSACSFLLVTPFYIGDAYYIATKSWLASILGISNIYYYLELSPYFAPEARSIPLLHTWSLGVEEQFYLLWPAVLFFWFKKDASQSFLAPVFLLALVGFLCLSIYMANTDAKAAYYLLPARVFEFMLGAGVSLLQLPRPNRFATELLSIIGIGLIGVSSVWLTRGDVFPGLNALSPTLGAALILYSGMGQKSTIVSQLLSTRILVWLGSLSYSLYLWHWPPIALMHYQLIDITLLNAALCIVGALVLSWMSYRLVEGPFRNLPWNFKKSFTLLVLLPAVFVWAVISTIRISDDLSFRFPESKRDIYKVIANNNAGDIYEACFKSDAVQFDRSTNCLFGMPTHDGHPNSMILGDSHAIAQIGFVESLLEGTDLYALMVTRASTPYLATNVAEIVYSDDENRYLRSRALNDYLRRDNMTLFVGA